MESGEQFLRWELPRTGLEAAVPRRWSIQIPPSGSRRADDDFIFSKHNSRAAKRWCAPLEKVVTNKNIKQFVRADINSKKPNSVVDVGEAEQRREKKEDR